MIFKRGRYSGFLRPISYIVDLIIIGYFSFEIIYEKSDILYFYIYISISWIVSTLLSDFYEIYRHTSVTKIFGLIVKQTIIFLLLVFAFFGFYNDLSAKSINILKYVLLVMSLITITKFAIFSIKLDLFNFQSVSYNYIENKDNSLEASVILNSKKKYAIGFGFDIKQSNIEDIGLSFENRFKTRNI